MHGNQGSYYANTSKAEHLSTVINTPFVLEIAKLKRIISWTVSLFTANAFLVFDDCQDGNNSFLPALQREAHSGVTETCLLTWCDHWNRRNTISLSWSSSHHWTLSRRQPFSLKTPAYWCSFSAAKLEGLVEKLCIRSHAAKDATSTQQGPQSRGKEPMVDWPSGGKPSIWILQRYSTARFLPQSLLALQSISIQQVL